MDKRPTSTSAEIDLVDLAWRAKEGIKKTRTIARAYFNRLWRGKFLFLFIVLLVTGAAYGLRFIVPPAYRTDAIFISYFLPARYYQMMVEDLRQLIRDDDKSAVAEQLRLSPEITNEISNISVETLPDPVFERSDTIRSPFRIMITVKSMSHLDAIQNGILYYLEGGDKGRQSMEEEEAFLRDARTALLNRLKQSPDSAKASVKAEPDKSEADGILKVNEKLKEVKRVEVVRPFLKRSSFNYPDYRKWLICGFLMSILLAMLIVPFTVSSNRSK